MIILMASMASLVGVAIALTQDPIHIYEREGEL